MLPNLHAWDPFLDVCHCEGYWSLFTEVAMVCSWSTSHCCYILHPSPICFSRIALSPALLGLLLLYCSLVYSPIFYLSGIPSSRAGLRCGQLVVLLGHFFFFFNHTWNYYSWLTSHHSDLILFWPLVSSSMKIFTRKFPRSLVLHIQFPLQNNIHVV